MISRFSSWFLLGVWPVACGRTRHRQEAGAGPAAATLRLAKLFTALRGVIATTKPHARLRLTEYRGVVSATMCYDALPVNDVFRKVDDQTLLAVMDLRGMERPFLFVLRREASSTKIKSFAWPIRTKIPKVIKNRAEHDRPRDINRDAKWCRLAMNEGPGGDICASHAAWRC